MSDKELLEGKLQRLFPKVEDRQIVEDFLNTYGEEVHEQEPYRVRLAVLKLADKNIELIKKYTEFAKQDYRDILAWAEYPRQLKKG